MIRILLTTPYDLAVPGGVNRHAFDLREALAGRGCDVRLIGPSSTPDADHGPGVTAIGRVWQGAFNGAVSRVTLDWRTVAPVRALVRSFDPDVLHVQEPFLPVLNTVALLCARRARRVGTFHTYSETARGYLYAWPWCNWVNSLLDARVAVSHAARDFAAQYHPGDYHVVPHGIRLPSAAPDDIAAEYRAWRISPSRPVQLLMVGRVSEPRKGYAVLREAFARLLRSHPGRFQLTVVGPDEPVTERLPIRWRGKLSDAELGEAYAAADLVIVPSLAGESFGLVPLEALVHGTPVVVSRIRGYAEWLEGGGAGELVPAGDAEALAAAILRLGTDPRAYVAAAARARVVAARFDRELLIDRLLRLYGVRRSNPLGSGHTWARNSRTSATTAGLGVSP